MQGILVYLDKLLELLILAKYPMCTTECITSAHHCQQCVCTAVHCNALSQGVGPQQHRAADPDHNLPKAAINLSHTCYCQSYAHTAGHCSVPGQVTGLHEHQSADPCHNLPEEVANLSAMSSTMCMHCRALWCAWSNCLAAPT